MPGRLAAALLAMALSLFAAPTHALGSIDLTLEGGTLFPLQVDGRVRIRIPGGLYFGGGAGWMPGGYVDIINDIATAFDAYDSATANLISESLDDSLLLDATLGWDPGAFGGFRIGGHYSYATLGGGVSARSAFEVATGLTVPPQIPDLNLPVESRLQMLGISLGFLVEFGILHVTTELAIRFPIASHSFIDTRAQGPAIDTVQSRVDDFFNDALLDLVIPSAGIYVGVNL